MTKQIIEKINVPNNKWVISKYDDSYSCNCPAWIFHRGQKVDCKHILAFKHSSQELTINISGLDQKSPILSSEKAHNSFIAKENDKGNDITLDQVRGMLI
jgi:hypothetical protein